MRRLLVGLCGALGLALIAVPPVTADSPVLPLGDPTLVETRESTVLAEGVTLTRIVRGRKYARESQIQTTTRGGSPSPVEGTLTTPVSGPVFST